MPPPPLTSLDGTTATTTAITAPWRPRWPARPMQLNWSRRPSAPRWMKHMRARHVRLCLLVGVTLLELVAVLIIVVLNAGGQQSDAHEVTSPDTYILKWTEILAVSTKEGTSRSEPFTLFWFLNGLCLQEGTRPMVMLSRDAGANFDWRRFDAGLSEYMSRTFLCNSTSGTYNVDSSRNDSDTTSAPTPGSTPNATRCALPSPGINALPPALNGQPSFGRLSFIFYIIDLVVASIAWPWIPWLEGNKKWQRHGRKILACTKGLAALVNVAAAALLVVGTGSVVKDTSSGAAKQEGDSEYGSTAPDDISPAMYNVGRVSNGSTSTTDAAMPVITTGTTASNLVWISAISQLLACALIIVANILLSQQLRNQGQRLDSRGRDSNNNNRGPNMRLRQGTLPIYHPRDSNARRRAEDGDEDEVLPPYQRDDPLGPPPTIEGYTHSTGCNIVYGSPVGASAGIPHGGARSTIDGGSEAASLSPSLGSGTLADTADNSGRQSPSPNYEEVVGVESISLLSNARTGAHAARPSSTAAGSSSSHAATSWTPRSSLAPVSGPGVPPNGE